MVLFMRTIEKQFAETNPKVFLKDAKPGQRYVLVGGPVDGAMVDVCVSRNERSKSGALVKTKNSKGEIHGWAVEDGRRKFTSYIDANGKTKKKFFYVQLNPDTELLGPVAKRGPKIREDGLRWRAWGLKNSKKMDSLIRVIDEEGFYVKLPKAITSHSASVEMRGETFCYLLMNGSLGFNKEPNCSLVMAFPVVYKEETHYIHHRIFFSDVDEQGRWSEFETTFRRQLKEWKRSYIANARAQS